MRSSPAPPSICSPPESRKAQYRDNAKTLRLAARDEEVNRRPSCEAIRKLDVPVLVLEGDHTDPAASVSNDALLGCLPPGAERARVPRSGRFWYVENPRDGADAILRFLAQHPITPR